MRLRFWVVSMAALLTATTAMADNGYPSRTGGGNYSNPRWYGYYYNNVHIPENYDHTNITMIAAVEENEPDDATQQSAATTAIEYGLGKARQYGVRAMVDVESIVFIVGTEGNHQCYYNNPNAATDFRNLVQTLITDHFLVPNAPQLGTVSSFYVADEPDGNCLADVGATHTPNPALLNAISVIRQNANTTNFPLATIVTYSHYAQVAFALGLFDWVGLDDYGDDVTAYMGNFGAFENNAQAYDVVGGTPQHFFLVPAVSSGLGSAGPYTNGAPYMQSMFLADNKIIGIMPLEWDFIDSNGVSQGMVGTSWAPSYIALGEFVTSLNSPTETTVIVDYLGAP